MKQPLLRQLMKVLWIGLLSIALLSYALTSFAQVEIYLPVVTTAQTASQQSSTSDDKVTPEAQDSQDTSTGGTEATDDSYEEKKALAIQLLSAHEPVADYLANYPGWSANAWQEGEPIWRMNFHAANDGEWLGNGKVNIESGEILEYFVPRELTPEEFQSGLTKVEAFIANDAEIQARLGDPTQWGHEVYYNRYDVMWDVHYWRGLDALLIRFNIYEGEIYLDEIADPNQLDAEEQAEHDRNQAIQLAYQAPGVNQALNGVDDWTTYVAHQSGVRWTVEFVADGQALFYALVDIESQTVIESG